MFYFIEIDIISAFLLLISLDNGSLFLLTDDVPNQTVNHCEQIPRDPNLHRQPGDGNYWIKIDLLPPTASSARGSGNSGLFWPFSLKTKSTGTPLSRIEQATSKSPLEYIPGREYQVTVSSMGPSAHPIEAVYLTAVLENTPESLEFKQGKGIFSPTICSDSSIGAIKLKYNFPNEVTFVWNAPKVPVNQSTENWWWNSCLELRATVVPWHWHRIFFRNTGALKRVLCPAKDIRRITDWPNYVEVSNIPPEKNNRNEQVRIRSVNAIEKTDTQEFRDRYSDSGFYGTDESGSCSLQEIPKPVRRCCACNTAIYRIVIQSEWQQQQHWRDWPTTGVPGEGINRSPHFSETLGASHSPLYDVFHMGWYASPAVDAMCTTGDVSKLENEFRSQAGENILTVIRTRGIDSHAPPEQRMRSALFAVNSSHHLISFLTRLVPSPDWCTGLSRVDICLPNCSWPKHMQFPLEPWDAGVMSGNTYIPVEPSERLREPKPMCPITPELRPSAPFTVITEYSPISSGHRAFGDSTAGDSNMVGLFPNTDHTSQMEVVAATRTRRHFAPLGMVYLELLRINEDEVCTPDSAQDDQGFVRNAGATSTTNSNPGRSNCQTSSWSQWGPCVAVDLDSCSNPGLKEYWSKRQPRAQRTRTILAQSTAADCLGIQLKEEKTCSPVQKEEKCGPIPEAFLDKSTKQSMESCQLLPWGPWSACINATCSRPGMIYRWRDFPDLTVRHACDGYPLMSQVDTCWPPPKTKCSRAEFASACSEEPPTSVRLCVRPQNGTTRYFYNPSQEQCKPFNYVPDCHLRALISGHRIGLTRNVFRDRTQCERMCRTSADFGGRSSLPWQSRRKRQIDPCQMARDLGTSCRTPTAGVIRWHFDSDEQDCLMFTYSGCGGNENNFPTKAKCQSACMQNASTSN